MTARRPVPLDGYPFTDVANSRETGFRSHIGEVFRRELTEITIPMTQGGLWNRLGGLSCKHDRGEKATIITA